MEVALSAVLCNGAVGCIMNVWGYQHWIPHWTFTCFLKTAIKALKQGAKFVQTYQSVVMLIDTHNHALGILLWQCSCHRNEKQNSESFFNYDANLTSVITMELKFIFFSLRCWFLCMTSLAVTSSMLKTSVKYWVTSFKFWLRPWGGFLWILWNLQERLFYRTPLWLLLILFLIVDLPEQLFW